MRLERPLRNFIAALLLAVVGAISAAGQTPSESRRIQELEERVRVLEETVRMLLAEREPEETDAAEADSDRGVAGRLLGDLAREEPPPAPAAAPAPAPLGEVEPLAGMPQELLPDLGKIGATAAFFAGAHNGPF